MHSHLHALMNTNIANRSFPGIRAGMAMEFCNFTGSLKEFKKHVPDNEALTRHETRYYTADEVRKARQSMGVIGTGKPLARADLIPNTPCPLMLPIIAVRMSKGGVGKTTIAANFASTLALMGHKVLMIDGDAQSSLTALYGIDWSVTPVTHIGKLMQTAIKSKKVDIESAIIPIYANGMLDLIASDITLAEAGSWLTTIPNREAALNRLFEQNSDFFSRYDCIIIDSAPGTDNLANTIMYAARRVLAPVWLDGQAIAAIEVLNNNISELNQAFASQGLKIETHLVANGYHAGYQTCKDSLARIAEQFGPVLDDNIIPHASGFMRQMSLYELTDSGPILEREPRSVGSRAIIDLTKSLIRLYGITLPESDQKALS